MLKVRCVHELQNTIEDIYNLMYYTNVSTWKDLIYQTQQGQLGVAHTNLWDLFYQGSYDDAGVGGLAQRLYSSEV